MMEYLIAKARIDELLKEAETERMLNQVKKQIRVIRGSNVNNQKTAEQTRHSKTHV